MPVGILSYLSSDPLTEAAAEQSVAFAYWARFSLQGPLYPLHFFSKPFTTSSARVTLSYNALLRSVTQCMTVASPVFATNLPH